MARLRGVVLLAVLSMIAAVVVSAKPWSSPAPHAVSPVAEAPDELTASLAAHRQGSRVEVASLRTETSTTYANPGGTWTLEQSVGPVRVRRGDGWVPVDTALTRAPDGTLTTKATTVGVRISGGGTAPMARLSLGAAELTLTWPTPLPTPEVEGDTATYADVLPGVDLRVRATDQGFGHDLVVRTREAAGNPALARVRLGLSAKGVRLSVDQAGNLSATDASGAVVYHAPAPLMWDSPDGNGPRTERPVGVELGRDSLTLLPDRSLLADPSARLPIAIDPYHSFVTPTAVNSWTLIRRAFPEQKNWNLRPHDEDTRIKGVARIGHAPGYGSEFLDRSVFQFDLNPLRGADVIRANFKIYQVWKYAHTCDANLVDNMVLHVTDPIGPGTSWNSHSNKWWGQHAWPRSVAKLGQPCGPDWVGMNVLGAVEAAANSGRITLGLRANNETGDAGWKRFFVQDGFYPKIEIEYNRRPSAPTGVRTEPALTPCHWCAGVAYAPDTDLYLSGVGSDPDGGQVTARWQIGSPALVRSQTIASGHRARTLIRTSDYADGTRVGWTLGISDGELAGPTVNGPSFTVDTTRPSAAPTVESSTYPEDNAWHGGVGVPGMFTFTAPTADDDIDHYLYGWQTPPTTKAIASSLGGSATATTAPPGDGPRTLYVRSVDRAGNPSDIEEHRVYVRAGNGARSQWSFEGNARDTAFLGDRHGTVNEPATYIPGAVGNAIRFDRGGSVTAPNTVPTDASFTASAWVRVDQVVHTHTAVSQSGDAVAGFELGYRTETDGTGRWFFRMPRTPDAAAVMTTAQSTQQAPDATWTHLAGVYDAAKGQLRLYVNGVLSATVAHQSTWNAGGDAHIGNALRAGVHQNHWLGAVDEVQLFDRAVGAAELLATVGSNNVQLAHWKFDERAVSGDPGTTAGNAVAGGDMAVLSEQGAEFVTPGASGDQGSGALALDGTSGHATTNAPTLRTDQSFTIAAWARLADTGVDTRPVISQRGANICGVCLQYQATSNKWVFVLPTSDANPPAGYDFVQSPGPAVADEWTHLVGIYDAAGPDGPEIRLYVNGELAGRRARPVSWRASGALKIGNGNQLDFFHGELDEVRLYSRAISDDEIRGIVSAEGVSEGSWKLDGDANDSSDSARHGQLTGDPAWVAGQTSAPDPSDLAVRLSGSGQYVSAPNAVATDRSFSVSAWARVDQAGRQAAVVSESGTTVSGFTLRTTAGGRWSFAMPRQDVSGGGGIDEALGTTVQTGVWTHLVGVYSRDRGRLELYVNGELAGTAGHASTLFTASGDVLIGRSKLDGDFAGAIDDVSVHSRPLFVDEIRAMAGRDLTLVHNWQLDERGGANAADSVGSRGGTLSGGAAFTSGRVGNSVHLDGVDDVVSTSGVDLSAENGFTVSSWVRLDSYSCASACRYTAVSLDGTQHSKFRLGHQIDTAQSPRGYWVFEMPEPDGAITEAAVSVLPGEVNKWVQLTGVYDAATGKLWLYVNGTRVDDGTLRTPWAASGALRIGRGQTGGVAADHWPGNVDEVRMYTGSLDKARVSALYRSFPAPAAPPELPAADAGHWTFDEASGTVAADAGGRLPATLKGGATWIGGRNRAAGWFDGTSGYAETAGPALHTEQSFSVSAWVYLAGGVTTDRVVLGQDGAQVSAFRLGYDAAARRWSVVVPTGDRPVVLTSTEAAGPADWSHLTVTYEANNGELRLYVNGVLSGLRLGVTVPESTGPFTIGRGKANGAPTGFFPRGIDDVRAFGKALTDGEVRRVHDAVPALDHGFWRFDADSGRDYSARNNPVTTSGGASYVDGISGRALALDGVRGAASASAVAVTMRESFTVSAWARLSRADGVATVVAQDGSRMSGFALQYRPELNRWTFGTRLSDSDGAQPYHVQAPQPARVGVWTHLVGIYDGAARELRLYVDGQPAGARGTGPLWLATGGLTIGRGKVDGAPAEFFPGTIDEVRVDVGIVPDEDIAERAGWPAPPKGVLGGYVDAEGDHRTGDTSEPVPAGFRFSSTLGMLPTADTPGTHPLYACVSGSGDEFTSREETCEGGTAQGEIGRVYTDPPEGVPSVPVYRCVAGADRFDALDCGANATVEVPLGHTIAYSPYIRYLNRFGFDHWSTTGGTPPSYRNELRHGWVPLTPRTDTVPLLSCRTGVDEFTSTEADCEGGQSLGVIGHIWPTPPSEVDTRPVYRCSINGQRFVSTDAACEGRTVEGPLGHVMYPSPVPGS